MNKYEYLGSGVSVLVSNEHHFGTDAIVLASFAKLRFNDKAIDLGTGCGIIPLLWCRQQLKHPVCCIDIQKAAVEQTIQSALYSGVAERINAQCADLRQVASCFEQASFTLVTMNPPYKHLGSGIESSSASDKIARHETQCSLADVVAAASYLLKFGGRLCMCHRPERLPDVMQAFRSAGIEPKRLRFVAAHKNKKPFLFLIEGRKGSKPFLNVEAPLFIDDDEMQLIYGDYVKEG